ncbi:MAG TPA: ATP-binding protein, partial [Firmicutes bacterium]|nr:ATP-binding protein [Bacillota bacterium]
TFNRKQIPELLLDRHRINQLMNNILSNAIKFSPSNSEVFIIEIPKDDEVEIIVKDEGPGIPKEKLKRIFDKFYQADMSDRRSTMGMGLGLAISKAIVEGHGGSIWAESEVGKGSAFHFTLKYINRQ